MYVVNYKARASLAIAGALFICIVSWLGGYDFNHRGPEAIATVVSATFIAAILALCPLFDHTEGGR